jgi:F0F1-type ATP synthase assembly protein I
MDGTSGERRDQGHHAPSLRERDEVERQRLWRLAGMGGTLATEVAAGALVGWLLDKLFKTAPVLLVVCTLGGVVVGMTTFIRRAMRETHQLPENLPEPLPPDPEDDDDAETTT